MRAPLPVTTAAPAAPNRATGVDDVFYPSSDGKPMAENMWQAKAILNAAGDLESARPNALVAMDILVYPEEGNNKNSIAPDVLVAFGLGTHNRMNYLVWAEGKPPDWVLEVASPSTTRKDLDEKRTYYAAMGVPEYWLFDPKGDVYPSRAPQLQGLKLVDGEYVPLDWRIAGGERMIRSEVLDLDVRAEDCLLRFQDVATGGDVQHRPEVEADKEHALAAVERARAAASRAEAQTEQASAQRKAAEARAEREAIRASREADRAAQETVARSAAEARVAELEEALRRSRAGVDDR